jgi:hypothetical protein
MELHLSPRLPSTLHTWHALVFAQWNRKFSSHSIPWHKRQQHFLNKSKRAIMMKAHTTITNLQIEEVTSKTS